jgi:predicted PurR-regulated permease PerM
MTQEAPSYIKFSLIAISSVIVLTALYLFKFIFIPLVMSLFLTGLFIPIMQKMRKKRIPIYFGIGFVFFAITIFILIINVVFYFTRVEYISKEEFLLGQWNEKLIPIYTFFQENLGINLNQNIRWNETLNFITENGVMSSVSPYIGMINSFVGMSIMTLIYTLILLAGAYKYREYIEKLGGKKNGESYLQIVDAWIIDLAIYLKVKTVVSLITGILFGVICFLFGLDFALFFGLLAFLLNFIPNLGSIIATILPLLLAFVQLDSFTMIGFLGVILLSAQLLLGSIIEVKYIGKSFSIPTIIVFINLLFWGYLWGIAGIILSVPIIIFIKNWNRFKNPDGFISRILS